MASMKLLVCCLALVAAVACLPTKLCPNPKPCPPKPCPPKPCPPKPCPNPTPCPNPPPCPPKPCPNPTPCPRPKPRCDCPDEWIRNYFIEIDVTVRCDWDYIAALIKLIESKRDCNEYGRIIDIYGQLELARNNFYDIYGNLQNDIYSNIVDYRNRYSPLSICYTERIVSIRKRARCGFIPDLCKFRSIYFQLIALIEEFCGKYNIDRQPRALWLPRDNQYNFGAYYPSSPHSNDLSLLYQTCFKDYRYLYDLINKLNFPNNSPLCGRKKQLIDELIQIWIDFSNCRRGIDIDFYPRFLDCIDNQDQIDLIYLDIIAKLRPYQMKFANCWFDLYIQYGDLCNENNIPFIDYIDYDSLTPQSNIRGLYIPSPQLQQYFSNILVTPRMDYQTACRLWRELDCKPNSPEWIRRKECLDELKRRLCELERLVNRLIRDLLRRFTNDYSNCLDNFDHDYGNDIIDIIDNCNKEIWPLMIRFRQQYYINDDCLQPILRERGIIDFSRNIIPCQTWGYDISVYCFDRDIRDLLRWIEECLRKNYYGPVNDLVQLQFEKGCEEYNLRCKALKDLECIWMDYRKIIHELFRKLIDLLCKRKIAIGCDEYRREIQDLINCYRPRFMEQIDCFKRRCFDINTCLDRLYKKNTSCRRSYFYVEASFEISIGGSRSC